MQNNPFQLDPAAPRCLAHDDTDRPNGCAESGRCARHLVLYHDPLGNIVPRVCQPHELDQFIAVADGAGGQE